MTDILKVNNNWVYQSNRLIEASYSFTVLEQKLIRLLASMVNKDDEEFKEYHFKATDLCKVLNIHPRNIYRELDQITDKLMSRYIKIKSDDSEKFKKRHLIKIADFENQVLTLKIDEDMKEFYLKLNWFTKYQLKNIMQFKSTYSFRLYELLKQYESIGHRKIEIEELRTILDIEKNQYPKYANLKQKVISVAVGEINKNTDINIVYEGPEREIKIGRKVTAIDFIIEKNKAVNEIAAGRADDEPEDTNTIKEVQDIIKNSIGQAVTKREAETIYKSAINHEVYKEPLSLIKEVCEYSKTQNIDKNLVGWINGTVKGYVRPKRAPKKDTFNSYTQRAYDGSNGQMTIQDIENRLLGWDTSEES